MRPGQQQNKRMRGRGRKGPNPLSRSYESNGPDVKIRGTAQHVAEKYSTLARDAAASGDRVMAENYLQHAEHYGRIVAAAQGSFQLQQDENDFSDQGDEDGDEDGGQEAGYTNDASSYHQPARLPQERGPQDRNGFDRNGGERNHQPAARDAQPVTREAREGRDGQREQPRDGNRDGNREQRANRDGRDPRNGNRDFNRDGRDANRGNFQRDTQNRDGQNRDAQNRDQRERPAPVGLGPQPFLPETAAPAAGVADARHSEPPREQAPQPVAEAPAREEFRLRSDEPRPEGEPRRRGRPRRIRPEEAAAGYAAARSPDAQATLPVEPASGSGTPAHPAQPMAERPAGDVAAPAPAEMRQATPAVPGAGPVDPDVKVKRKPGRPRKKKPEDDGPGEGGDHLPAFLMASNG